jgi:hypothetical protein
MNKPVNFTTRSSAVLFWWCLLAAILAIAYITFTPDMISPAGTIY